MFTRLLKCTVRFPQFCRIFLSQAQNPCATQFGEGAYCKLQKIDKGLVPVHPTETKDDHVQTKLSLLKTERVCTDSTLKCTVDSLHFSCIFYLQVQNPCGIVWMREPTVNSRRCKHVLFQFIGGRMEQKPRYRNEGTTVPDVFCVFLLGRYGNKGTRRFWCFFVR